MSSHADSGSLEKTPAGQAQHQELAAPVVPPRTLGRKLWTLAKAFWWLLLILFVAGFLLVTLLIVYVGFPHIAQTGVDDATLAVLSLEVTNPTETSFHMKQVSQLNTSSVYRPWVYPFNASLALAGDDPYCQILIPGTRSEPSVTVTVDQDVHITDLDAFTRYNAALLGNRSIGVAFDGSATLQLGALPATTVTYDKVVNMAGFNGLKGLTIPQLTILLEPLPDGSNMNGTAVIPNPSVITVEMGNVTMNLYVKGDYIGTSTIPNLTLRPGNNSLPMTSIVNQTYVIDAVTNTYKDANLPIDIVANSSVYNGVHLTYFEKALESAPMSITLSLCGPLNALGLKLPC